MKTTQNLHNAFSFKAITNESVNLGMQNAARKYITNLTTNSMKKTGK